VTGLALGLGVALAVVAVLLVTLPFLREPQPSDDTLHPPPSLDALEERDRALAALKELEFDHRTGKIGDEDYRALVGPLRQAAAVALRAIDRDARYGEAMSDPTAFEPPQTVPEPYPPPDEGTPPTPEPVEEPYPPDELTPPSQPVVPEPGSQD